MSPVRRSRAITRRECLTTGAALFLGSLNLFAQSFNRDTQEGAANRPKQILIIRHAEKSDLKTDVDLNPRGYARAAALPTLFPSRFPIPDFLFAARQSKHSNRPVETITPLARALGLKIDNTYPNEDFGGLARRVLKQPVYGGKIVLICWHHENIPALARALGVTNAPAHWPEKRFDQVWRIEYPEGAAALTELGQQLLAGDS